MVLLGVEFGVEGAVGEVVDTDAVDGAAELRDHLDEEVVGQGPFEGFTVHGELHRLGLVATDEDGKEFVARAQDDDGRPRPLVADADADPFHGGLVHITPYG